MKTLKQIVEEREPGNVNKFFAGGVWCCPEDYEYLQKYTSCHCVYGSCDFDCDSCWNREVDANEP